MTRRLIIGCVVLISAWVMAAEFELGSPFGDMMVLQRQMTVPVWGWGEPGKSVAVSVAGEKASGKVGEDGCWRIDLPALKAGGPHNFTAQSGDKKIEYKNVLIGEVWICSGQSNMQMGRGAMNGAKAMEAQAKGRSIRFMEVQRTVRFKEQDKCVGSWSAGLNPSAVAFSFSLNLQKKLDVPVGILLTCWGSSSIEGWMPLDMQDELPHFKKELEKFEKNDREKVARLIEQDPSGKKWARKDNIYLRTRPNILYNAMLHPLAPYACRGLAWYQGESNAGSINNMFQYRESLQKWCLRLRKEWGRDDFHLLAVMLPRFGRIVGGAEKGLDHPAAQSWAYFRESQAALCELPHTGIANTIDLGDVKNIHPKDKAPVGERLALLAARDVNGMKIVGDGPLFKEMTIKGGEVTISYENSEGLKTKDGKAPEGFYAAGKDRKWAKAEARIEGEKIVLTCESVPKPKAVRYAFAAAPTVNLVNGAGLPARPFRTDRDEP